MDLRDRAVSYYRQQRPAVEVISLISAAFGDRFESEAQTFLVENCIGDSITQKFPPSAAYIKRLLKIAIDRAENQGSELEEHILQLYLANLNSTIELSQWSYKTYTYGYQNAENFRENVDSITVHVSSNMLEGGTGCKEWEASFVLAEFILNNPKFFKGKVCLELGCGVGLVGVCLKRIGAKQILLTDGQLDALGNCSKNLQINGISPASIDADEGVTCVPLNWEDGSTLAPDVIVASDVVYNPEVVPCLVQCIKGLMKNSHKKTTCVERKQRHSSNASCKDTVESEVPFLDGSSSFCLVVSTVRNEDTLEVFLKEGKDQRLVVDDVSEMMSKGDISFHCLPFKGAQDKAFVAHCLRIDQF